MAKYSNTVEYQIRTTLDSSGIAKLKAELTSLQSLAKNNNAQNIMGFDTATTNKVLSDINKVKTALDQAFNPKLGMVSNKALFSSIGKDLNSIYSSFSKLGPQGVQAFGQVYQQIGKIDLGMKQISSTSDKIMNTFGNTFRWGIIASMFSSIMNSFHQATQYVQDLDTSLTNIMMVSGESRDAMNEYAKSANEAAKALGNTTVGMTNATQVFVQQGYDLGTSQQLAESSVILGNISQQDTATASDEITAYMNAFKINIDDLNNALSKWAIVANVSAADVQELSIASQKAASAAVTTGVNMDQLAAQIATIETVTREAPENIGNGLKTLYARFSDIKMGETLEDGVDLGKVTSTLEAVGVQVLNAEGNMREVGDIMEDLMDVWGQLDLTQKNAIGQTLAGKFQYTRFSALMNRSDLYKDYLAASEGETGTQTFDMMQAAFEDSMQGRLNKLQATIEGIFTKAFNTDNFYVLIDAATTLAETFDNLVQAMGGGGQAILAFSAIMTKTFSNKIGEGISNMIANRATNTQAQENREGAMTFAKAQLAGQGLNVDNKQVMDLANNRAQITQYAPSMSNEQIENANQLWQKQTETFQQLIAAETQYEEKTSAIRSVLVQLGFSSEQADVQMEALLQTFEASGKEAQITKETLASLNIESLINQIYGMENSLTSLSEQLKKAQETGKGWEEAQASAELVGVALTEIGEKCGFVGDKAKLLEEILEGLQAAVNGDLKSTEAFGGSAEKLGQAFERLRNGLETIKDASAINSEALVEERTRVESLRAAYDQLLEEGRGMSQGLQTQKIVSGLANLASAGMTAVFSIQSLINIFKIWNNEDLTIGEKVEQLAMNIAMVAAMGIPAITQTTGALRDMNVAIAEQGAVLSARIALENGVIATLIEQAGSERILTQEKIAQIASEAKLSEEKVASMAIRRGLIVETNNETLAETANATAKSLSKKETLSLIALEKLQGSLYTKTIGKIGLMIAARAGLITMKQAEEIITGKLAIAELAATAAARPLIALAAPLGVLVGIITLVGVGLNMASEAEKRRKQHLEETIEANKDMVNSIHENANGLNELMNEYYNTGTASDELKTALLDQAKALNITNAELYISLGKYEELKDKIDQTTTSVLEYNNALLGQQKDDAIKDLLKDNSFGSGLNGPLSLGASVEAFGAGQTAASYVPFVRMFVGTDVEKNIHSVTLELEKANREYALLQAEIKKYEGQTLSPGKQQIYKNLKNRSDQLESNISSYNNYLRDSRIQTVKAAEKQAAENEFQIMLTDSQQRTKTFEDASTYEDYVEQIKDSKIFPEIASYLEGLTEEQQEKYINSLVKQLGIATNDLKLSNLADYEATKDLMLDDILDSQIDQFGFTDVTSRDNFKNQIKELYDEAFTILDNANIDEEDKIKIAAGLDYNQSKTEIEADLQQIITEVQNGGDVNKIMLRYGGIQVQEEATTYKSEIPDILKDADITDADFVKYQESWLEGTESLALAQKQLNGELEEGTELAVEFKDQAEMDEFLEDATAAALETYNGLKKLNSISEETWETLNDISKEDWNLGNIDPDTMKDIENLREGLGEALNVDPSLVSDSFIQDHLGEIQAAAEEDVVALNNLRNAFSEEYILNMEINAPADQIEGIRANLFGYLDEIQATLPELEIGASLNDTAAVQGLEDLVNKGYITVEDLNASFGNIQGIEFDVEPTTVQVPNIVAAFQEASNAAGGNFLAGMQGAIEWITSGTSSVTVPKLVARKSGNGSGGGSHGNGAPRFSPSSSSSGSKGKSGGSGGGGKGGSGGGSGKSYEPKQKEYKTSEKDRYEKVNTALDKIDSQLDQITMDQDRLIGTRAIDNLEKETDLLKEQIPWYQQKLEIQKEEARELRDQLSSDFGAQFGTNGQLQNYSSIFDQLEKERKAAYDKYNAETTEEGQKAAEEAIKQIEDRQAAFEKLYSRYDTLWSKDIPDTEKALKEIQDRLEDIAEEAHKARREAAQDLADLRDTMRDTEQTYNNLFGEHPTLDFEIAMDNIEDILGGDRLNAELQGYIDDYKERLKNATDEDIKDWYRKQIEALEQVQKDGGTSVLAYNRQRMEDADRMWEEWQSTGHYTIEGQDSTNEQALLDIMNEVIEDSNKLMSDLSSAISDAMSAMEGLEEMMDSAIENQLAGMDAVDDRIEHQQNMMELLYGDQASARQVDLLNLQAANEENRLKVLEEQAKTQKGITEARKALWEADKDNKDLADAYYESLQKEQDIDGEILDTREKIAETYRDAKEAANNLAVDNWLKNFDGQIDGVNIPIEYMADQWERIQENEELYLDDLNKAYEIQKLSNKYQQMLNDATDPKIQQQITDQMREQLAYLNEKTNLSKHDVDYANAQLEILQKTIALEDARAAKNQMKLRRDSQGNYQYVYAADQNQTAEAENDLLDASMNAYNMSKEQQADVQDSYIKKVQDMADALRKAANDSSLTQEQIAVITQDIIDTGWEYLDAMGEQLSTSQKNMIMSFIDAAGNISNEFGKDVHDIADKLQEDMNYGLGEVDKRFDTSVKLWIENEEEFQDSSNETRDTIIGNIGDFVGAVGDANIGISEPLNDMDSDFNKIDDDIVSMKTDMEELFNLLGEKSGAFKNAAADVKELQTQLHNAQNELSEYTQKIKGLEQKIAEQQVVITGYENEKNGRANGSSGNVKAAPNGQVGDGVLSVGDDVYYSGGSKGYHDSLGSGPNWTYNNTPGWYEVYNTANGMTALSSDNGKNLWAWVEDRYLSGYDTGGYTGEWGSDGRVAMLHQKELVLNATDTQNILAAVDAVRMITEQLKGTAFINNIGSSIGKAAQSNIQGNSIEQRIEITANFPNVNSAEEIEKAFNSIADRSYQYAYNKNDIPW